MYFIIKKINNMKITTKWFTLIEIMLWILIFSIVMIAWFQSVSNMNYWKIKIIQETSITKDAFYFSQKLFEEIKAWWSLDYEEYFGRRYYSTETYSGHYRYSDWYWNFWDNWVSGTNNYGSWFYYCKSTTTDMWTWGCITWFNTQWSTQVWEKQRYWEYAFQFIDYNSNHDSDWWDEDWDWSIRWDDDDENLWEWPVVFTWWTDIKEVYLISWDKKKRLIIRWQWLQDTNKPSSVAACTPTWVFSDWCIWKIEVLKLDWKDWWINHNKTWTWAFDGIIDTWVVDPDYSWWAEVVYGSDSNNYRLNMFPDTLSVKDFEVYAYPNKDRNYSWKDYSASTNVNPYIKIKIVLTPSRKKRVTLKWTIPDITINQTINLSDYFSK